MIGKKIVTALICECNPFHDGHKIIINKAKEFSDYLVCIMSPDFVQRGEPAVFDKYKRCEDLLNNGADLVIELPVEYVLSSASYFAYGAVSIANKLSFVDNIIFGSFINDFEKIDYISDLTIKIKIEYSKNKNNNIINKQYDDLNKKIYDNLHMGMSYPKAVGIALSIDFKSNDILNIEYLNSLKLLKSKIKPIIIERKNNSFSATELRKNIKNCININDFSYNLNQVLFNNIKNKKTFLEYCDNDENFNNSLIKNAMKNISFEDRVNELATKNRTKSKVKRNLFHILIDIKNKDLKNINCLRVLGFKEKSKILINNINLPYSLAWTKNEIEKFNTDFFDYKKNRSILINIYASDLYQFVSKNYQYENIRKVVKV